MKQSKKRNKPENDKVHYGDQYKTLLRILFRVIGKMLKNNGFPHQFVKINLPNS